MTLVLDAGALIAVERADRSFILDVQAAWRAGRAIVVPAGVLAQVWRGGSRQARLTRFLTAHGVKVEVLGEVGARACGVVCGRAGTADIVDASVIVAALRHRATVITSDRADLELLDPGIAIIDC